MTPLAVADQRRYVLRGRASSSQTFSSANAATKFAPHTMHVSTVTPSASSVPRSFSSVIATPTTKDSTSVRRRCSRAKPQAATTGFLGAETGSLSAATMFRRRDVLWASRCAMTRSASPSRRAADRAQLPSEYGQLFERPATRHAFAEVLAHATVFVVWQRAIAVVAQSRGREVMLGAHNEPRCPASSASAVRSVSRARCRRLLNAASFRPRADAACAVESPSTSRSTSAAR